ncbi:MAG: energy transducer TonB [Vulcanimicrobiaceae bacterium]
MNTPQSAVDAGAVPATVIIEVTIYPSGSPTSATFSRSGNNMSLDREAKRAEMSSTYYPKIVNCKKVTGHYLFEVDFTND